MVIYKITNKTNDKIYIGQTTQSLTERWHQHCHRSPSQDYKSAVHNAILKYGKDNFKIEQIAEASSLDELNALEIKYIEEHNSLFPLGYNLLKGGDNKECHETTKAKISQTLKGRPIKNRQNGAKKGRKCDWGSTISKSMTGVAQPWKYKQVLAIETGIVYESVQAAANAVGIGRSNLCLLLKSGKTHKKTGLTFKFVESPKVPSTHADKKLKEAV